MMCLHYTNIMMLFNYVMLMQLHYFSLHYANIMLCYDVISYANISVLHYDVIMLT